MKIVIGLIALLLLVAVLRVGELYTQLGRYQRYWQKTNQKPVNKDDLVYVAFGDSAAQGIGASSPDKGYVGLIAKDLAKDQPVSVINFSKSGAKVRDVLETQLPKYQQLNLPNRTVLTMEIGANDILTFEPNKFEREMDELLGKLPKNTIVSDLPSFKGSRLAKYNDRVVEANVIIHKLAKKHDIKLANLYQRTEASHGPRVFAADIFHPSNHGYSTNWAPAFLDQINSPEHK